MNSIRQVARDWIEGPAIAGRKLAAKIDWSSAQPGRITVLCLERSQFIKDMEELRRLTHLNWVALSASKVKDIEERWVPEVDRQQGYFSAWLAGGRSAHLRPKLEAFAVALLQEAARHMRVDAVAAANIDYWQDEALKLGCEKLGIPFLVISRENYSIPFTVPWKHNHIAKAEFKFSGAGIAVFSESTKIALEPCVENPDDIWVTGAPRYDPWQEAVNRQTITRPASEKDYVTLITFNDPGYMGAKVFKQVAEVFDQAATRHNQGLTWLVKCKKRGDQTEVLEHLAKQTSALRFEYDVSLLDLLPRSRAVVGYNSLALVEALLTDAPVILPRWGETDTLESKLLFNFNDPLVERVVTFARSPSELGDLLARAAAGEPLKTGTASERRALFGQHIYIPADGTACGAIERFVMHYVDRRSEKAQIR
jgi:hypothetical protein